MFALTRRRPRRHSPGKCRGSQDGNAQLAFTRSQAGTCVLATVSSTAVRFASSGGSGLNPGPCEVESPAPPPAPPGACT